MRTAEGTSRRRGYKWDEYPPLPDKEIEALLDLRKSLVCVQWKRKMLEGWANVDIDHKACLCSGLTIESDRIHHTSHIIEIDMPAGNLMGELPETIAQFSHLRVLRLHNNKIAGSLPEGQWPQISSAVTCLVT